MYQSPVPAGVDTCLGESAGATQVCLGRGAAPPIAGTSSWPPFLKAEGHVT